MASEKKEEAQAQWKKRGVKIKALSHAVLVLIIVGYVGMFVWAKKTFFGDTAQTSPVPVSLIYSGMNKKVVLMEASSSNHEAKAISAAVDAIGADRLYDFTATGFGVSDYSGPGAHPTTWNGKKLDGGLQRAASAYQSFMAENTPENQRFAWAASLDLLNDLGFLTFATMVDRAAAKAVYESARAGFEAFKGRHAPCLAHAKVELLAFFWSVPGASLGRFDDALKDGSCRFWENSTEIRNALVAARDAYKKAGGTRS